MQSRAVEVVVAAPSEKHASKVEPQSKRKVGSKKQPKQDSSSGESDKVKASGNLSVAEKAKRAAEKTKELHRSPASLLAPDLAPPEPIGVDRALLDVAATVASLPSVISAFKLLKAPGASLTWDRAWAGALPPLVAAMASHFNSPILVLVPQPTELESVRSDLSALLENPIEIFPQASEEDESETLLQRESLQRLQVLSNLQAARTGKVTAKSTKARAVNYLPHIVVTTGPAIMHGVPAPQDLAGGRRVLSVGNFVDQAELRKWLESAGYVSTTAVQFAGEFTFRGGILDIFPPDLPDPLRLEWFDDELESIRTFDTLSQRSIELLDSASIASTTPIEIQSATLLDYFDSGLKVCIFEPEQVRYFADAFLQRVPFPDRFFKPDAIGERLSQFAIANFSSLAEQTTTDQKNKVINCPLSDVQRINGELDQLARRIDAALAPDRTGIVVCINEPEKARMQELFSESAAFAERRLSVHCALLSHGFEIADSETFPPKFSRPMVLTVTQLLKRTTLPRSTKKASSRAIDSFLDLRPGDYVVHLSHGIGIYRGLKLLEKFGQKHEHLEIEFAEETKLFVPTTKIDLVQRYIGGSKSQPRLAKIGGQSWSRQKQAAEAAVVDMAADYLELQAQRRSQPGIAFSGDTVWQSQFEGSFPYEETPDQITAVAATKHDMLQARPMDRLICGDVGFGKTEVAMRAAFKAVDSGYQVAVLVPTTVLAEQHYKTFRQRMADFPFDIVRLSRFCSAAEQKQIVKRVNGGQVDIVIGTSRLISKDVDWFNLGLVIVDEEQRFGVAVKERLKQQRPNVDLMTLSATPIPRTLHMSLLGVRDISNLETAPQERLAVETKVIRFDEPLIRNAILRELNRGGQIFFVHNRVGDMGPLSQRLQKLVPEARIVVGHGQMPERALEKVMVDFIEHRFDILLATTIIESGLDIPNANTIFIDRADHYGLSELHQLRGRVGRYKNQAYCYMLIDKHKHLNPDAARRMHAIEEYSQIGAGFGIAMRDLEIRGAGNLLGTQQSGHIAAVGYELYCQLLENAVRHLRHQPPKLSIDVEVNLPVEAFLSSDYVPEIRHKIDLYRRLSRLDDMQKIADLKQEMNDRFGRLPTAAKRLFEIAELRIDATLWSVRYIGVEGNHLIFTYGDQRRVEQLSKRHNGKLKLLGQQRAYWAIDENDHDLLALSAQILQP